MTVSWWNLRSRQCHEARVLLKYSGLYARLNWSRWYHIRPGERDDESRCWVIGYGVKELVELQHFETRELAQETTHS